MILSTDKFVKTDSNGNITFSGRLGDYLDSLVPVITIQGSMGIQGITGAQGEPGQGAVDIPQFKAVLSQPWGKAPAQFEVMPFDVLDEENNNPGYSVGQFSHDPSVQSGSDLWIYIISAEIFTDADISLALTRNDLLTTLESVQVKSKRDIQMVSSVIWEPGDESVLVQMFTSGSGDTVTDIPSRTYWTGYRVGQVSSGGPTGGTFTQTISLGANDAHQASDGSDFNQLAVTLKVEPSETASNRYAAGTRFSEAGIPQGATIVSAKMSVVYPTGQRDSISAKIYGHKDVNSLDFTDDPTINGRTLTNSFVPWVGDDLGSGVYVDSPDVSPVVQELVNQPGWTVDSAIALITKADSVTGVEATRWTPYENTPGDACKIEVVWTN